MQNHKLKRMIQTITQTDLLRQLYKETSIDESYELENCIRQDENLKKEYLQLNEVKTALDSLILSPNDSTIENILNYSRQTKL